MSNISRIGDDYPVAWRNNPGNGIAGVMQLLIVLPLLLIDSIKLINWIHPRGLGHARQWGGNARSMGYRVDNIPTRGSVAYLDDGLYGHVAWVSAVKGDNVEIEEYNYGSTYQFRYHSRVVPKNSFTGYIHFKDLKSSNTSIPDTPTPTDNTGSNLASSGSYQFTERVSIKAEPKMSAPELAYYEAGNTVNYDKTLQADGYVWISYLSYAGNRRYIPVQKAFN